MTGSLAIHGSALSVLAAASSSRDFSLEAILKSVLISDSGFSRSSNVTRRPSIGVLISTTMVMERYHLLRHPEVLMASLATCALIPHRLSSPPIRYTLLNPPCFPHRCHTAQQERTLRRSIRGPVVSTRSRRRTPPLQSRDVQPGSARRLSQPFQALLPESRAQFGNMFAASLFTQTRLRRTMR